MINLFKKSIDKVFESVSAFTWEKYKEGNDDENDEENYQEFEEIKKMVLDCRDCALFGLDCFDLNKKQIKEAREEIDSCNELLQLNYSLANLSRLREFKEKEDEDYQEFLNDGELQNDLREWRQLRNAPEETNRREFEDIKKMVLYFRDRSMYYLECYDLSQEEIQEYREQIEYCNELLESEFSLGNLLRLKGFKEANERDYQENWLNNSYFQENFQKWKLSRNNIGGSVSALFEKVRSIIADQLGVDASRITLKTEFVRDLGVDSLDVVELIMALEEKFDIEIPDEQAEKIVNVGDVVRYIEN